MSALVLQKYNGLPNEFRKKIKLSLNNGKIFQEKHVEENPKALSTIPQKNLQEDKTYQKLHTEDLTPITAEIKRDLHVLVLKKLAWDDNIPDNL